MSKINPQKYYLRIASKALYNLGFGTFWYEDTDSSYPRLYAVWCIVVNVYMAAGVLDEVLSCLQPELAKEKLHEAIQFGFGHMLILVKVYIMILQKHRIRRLFKRLLEDRHDYFELNRESVKKSKGIFRIFAFGCYSYLILITVQWSFVSYRDGTPLETPTVYFPTSANIGFFFGFLRVLIVCHWWGLLTIMLSADCLCFMTLVFVATKFKNVQMYFKLLREKSLQGEEFKNAVVDGIKMHENALWCAKSVQFALGNICSAQICQTILMLGFGLIQAVALERTALNLVFTGILMSALALLTGFYMISSDDITHEAALVSTAIFHCGWEHVVIDRGLRAVLVVAIQRAQKPVYLKAFGFLVLSRQSFIAVLRAAYSFFALVY